MYDSPDTFAMNLRLPSWSRCSASVAGIICTIYSASLAGAAPAAEYLRETLSVISRDELASGARALAYTLVLAVPGQSAAELGVPSRAVWVCGRRSAIRFHCGSPRGSPCRHGRSRTLCRRGPLPGWGIASICHSATERYTSVQTRDVRYSQPAAPPCQTPAGALGLPAAHG